MCLRHGDPLSASSPSGLAGTRCGGERVEWARGTGNFLEERRFDAGDTLVSCRAKDIRIGCDIVTTDLFPWWLPYHEFSLGRVTMLARLCFHGRPLALDCCGTTTPRSRDQHHRFPGCKARLLSTAREWVRGLRRVALARCLFHHLVVVALLAVTTSTGNHNHHHHKPPCMRVINHH